MALRPKDRYLSFQTPTTPTKSDETSEATASSTPTSDTTTTITDTKDKKDEDDAELAHVSKKAKTDATTPTDKQQQPHDSFKPFRFVQFADTQLGMLSDFGKVEGWEKEKEFMQLAIAEINRIKPAFAIVCGDLTNEYPNQEQKSNQEKRTEQIKDFHEVASKIDPSIGLICVCGNHDVGNRPTAASIAEYTTDFGDDYFSFWCQGCKCIVTNSQLWKDDTDAKSLREKHDRWLLTELESAVGAKHVFVFGHVPIFIQSPDEHNGYFNIANPFRTELLDSFSQHGCHHYFCGHYHRNAGGIYTSKSGATVEVIVTGACGTNLSTNADGDPLNLDGIGGPTLNKDTSGVRIVNVEDKTVSHKWHSLNQLPNVK